MCFSAGASFGAGVVLSTIGVASIKKIQQPSQLPFATIPLIFAVQQFSEGFLWLSLKYPAWEYLQVPMTYTFLFFAQIVWPFWVPFSVLKIDPSKKRKAYKKLFFTIGIVVSTYLAYCLLSFKVLAKIEGSHISYHQDYPSGTSLYGGILYILATVFPTFLSSIKLMWSLGTAIFSSYIITTIFYEGYIVSVWCFFAAIISIAVFAILYSLNRSQSKTVWVSNTYRV